MSWNTPEEVELRHRTPDCTGEWRQEQGRHWRCSECHILYHRGPDVNRAARMENSMGTVLRVLAKLGQQQRDSGEDLPKGWER